MENRLTLSDDEIKNFLREGAKNGNKILLQKALNAGADLDISLNQALTFSFIGKHLWNRDSLGYRAIHWAARYGREEIVQWLVEQGASLEQPNDVGNTALHVAVYYNQYQVVAKLLDLGANPNAVNHESTLYQVSAETPLHYAVLYSSDDMVKILRDFGADAIIEDGKGKSPLAYAQSKGDADLIDALTQYIPNSSPKPGQRHNLEFKPQSLQENELFELAKGFLKSHELSQALECYSEVLNRDSKNKKALIGKGHVFRAQLEPQKAITCYESVLVEDSEAEDALFNKAMALIELCKYTEAISIIQQLIATKHTDEIGNYKDLARYMQQHYSYLPPNLDLEDVARAMTQSQQLSSETLKPETDSSSSTGQIDSPLPPPPPPLPPPKPVFNPNPVEPRPRQPVVQVQRLNIMDILQEEMKKRLAKMNPEAQQANVNAKSNQSSDSDENEFEIGSESSLKM